jgi:phage protein U
MAFDPIPLFNRQVFARLGDFIFELLSISPERTERDTSYRWARQEPIGARPVHQYLGATGKNGFAPHEDRIVLTGSYFPEFSGSIDHLKKLRDLAATGKAQRLILADTQLGQNLGTWIIHRIKENRSIFYGDGIPRKVEFTLELEFYG